MVLLGLYRVSWQVIIVLREEVELGSSEANAKPDCGGDLRSCNCGFGGREHIWG
jgi:hypothetical protein